MSDRLSISDRLTQRFLSPSQYIFVESPIEKLVRQSHLIEQILSLGAASGDEVGALIVWKVEGLARDRLDEIPVVVGGVGPGHEASEASRMRRSSQALATIQSRLMERGETPMASAVSSTVRPAK